MDKKLQFTIFGAITILMIVVTQVTALNYQSNKMSHEIQELRDDAARKNAQ